MPNYFEFKKKPESNKDLAAVMDMALGGAIKIKRAAEVGRRAVNYFRGADFCRLIMKNRDMIVKKHTKILDGNTLETTSDIEEFGDKFIREGFIYRAQYKPLDGIQENKDSVKMPKWPKRLACTHKQVFESDGFYILVYEGSKSWDYLILLLIIITVLAICMFPAWPLSLKLGVWYISVIIVSIIMVIVIGRLLVFVFFWFFGADMWILPNLFNEEAGIIDSFIPLYNISIRKDDWFMFASRIFCAIILAISTYKLGETHSVSDVGNFAKQSFLDVLEWGHNKLTALPEIKSKFPSLNDVERSAIEGRKADSNPSDEGTDSDDYKCLENCGFTNFEQLMTKCFMSCDCTTRLLSSECYAGCSEETKKILIEAQIDACDKMKKKKKRAQKYT